MWTGIIVIGVAIGLFMVARVVISGSFGRLRFGDKPTDGHRDGYGPNLGGGDGPGGPI
jgi:hypothetical protein